MYNANKKLIPGADAIDCQLEDINGKTIKLSDLYGKVLYLDIWATWCGPCCEEIPYMENLPSILRVTTASYRSAFPSTGRKKTGVQN